MSFDELRKHQQLICETGRNIRNETGDEVLPVAFVLSLNSDAFAQVPLAAIPKDQWRAGLIQLAEQMHADAVIVQSEAWVAHGTNALGMRINGVPAEDIPGRKEAIVCWMETRTGRSSMLFSFIEDGVAGPVESPEGDNSPVGTMGRLTGFFE